MDIPLRERVDIQEIPSLIKKRNEELRENSVYRWSRGRQTSEELGVERIEFEDIKKIKESLDKNDFEPDAETIKKLVAHAIEGAAYWEMERDMEEEWADSIGIPYCRLEGHDPYCSLNRIIRITKTFSRYKRLKKRYVNLRKKFNEISKKG